MKFQFISKQGDSLDMAYKVATEGNKVSFYCERRKVPNGVINVVATPVLDSDSILVFDHPDFGKQSDNLRRAGHTCIGASLFGSNVELNDLYNRSISNIIDEKLPNNIWVEGWFNGEDWIVGTASISYRDTHFLAGDLGVTTDYESSVFLYWKRLRPSLFKNTLMKLTTVLRKAQYIGPIRYGNKLSAGLGIDNMNGMLPLVDCGRLLSETAKEKLKRVGVSYDYGTTIRVSYPPYPYSKGEFEYVYGCGPTIRESRERAIEKAGKTAGKEKQYRIDAGNQAGREIPKIIREDSKDQRSVA